MSGGAAGRLASTTVASAAAGAGCCALTNGFRFHCGRRSSATSGAGGICVGSTVAVSPATDGPVACTGSAELRPVTWATVSVVLAKYQRLYPMAATNKGTVIM